MRHLIAIISMHDWQAHDWEGSPMSTMSKGSKGRAVTDDYFKLVRAFPLRPVRGELE